MGVGMVKCRHVVLGNPLSVIIVDGRYRESHLLVGEISTREISTKPALKNEVRTKTLMFGTDLGVGWSMFQNRPSGLFIRCLIFFFKDTRT